MRLRRTAACGALALLTGLLMPAGDTRAAGAGGVPPPVIIEFFYETGCQQCERVQHEILPELEQRYSGFYERVDFDIGETSNYVHLVTRQQGLGVTNNAPVCMVVDGRELLADVDGIRQGLFPALERALARRAAGDSTAATVGDAPSAVAERVRQFTLAGIVAAAVVDSINPCAMATLVFFMSLLSVSHFGVRRMALAGVAFLAACYVTYFAIGFGLLRVIRSLEAIRPIRLAIDLIMLGLMVLFAWLSFRDAIRFRRTGNPAEVALQLPDSLKNRIHAVMKRGLRMRNLVLGGVGIGAVVTVLESVCTGQVYVPALVLMIKSGESSWRCAGYLALYNAIFVAPLAIILGVTCWGLGTPALVAWSRRNVVFSKVLLGLFFTGMAAMMAILIVRSFA